jgi:uncharacterized protein YjbI with pentapeptide repeats
MVEYAFDEHRNPPMRTREEVLESANFQGNRDHLEAFARLSSTQIRDKQRSEALHEWKKYNRIPTFNSRGIAVKSTPRFRGVDLRGADLRNLYVGYVDLRGAHLEHADLRGVRMKGAWLDGARLEYAKLDGAYFAFASFAYAKLMHSSARETNFREAKLIGADFTDSDLTGALLADTQHRDWNLRDVKCEHVYWSVSGPSTTYAPKEFENLFSEDAMITLESTGAIDQQQLASLPMLVQALKTRHGASVRLQGVEDRGGRFLIRLKVEDSAGQAKNELMLKLEEIQAALNQPRIINTIITNQIAAVAQLNQGIINLGGSGQQEQKDMVNITNENIGSIGVQNQGDTINSTTGDISMATNITIGPPAAKALEDIVATKPAEKEGFTEELKGEVTAALRSIALEQAKALPGRVYGLLKEFFPSYVRLFLP